MALKIIWSNPLRPRRGRCEIRRIGSCQFGSVYEVTDIDSRQEFDVLDCQVLPLPDRGDPKMTANLC